MIVKVCGLTQAENIREVVRAGADWIGMIFWPHSPRAIKTRPDLTGVNATRVGVFVDMDVEKIAPIVDEYRLDCVQLHGGEPPMHVRALRHMLAPSVKIIKAISVSSALDIANARIYDDSADFLLFDTKCNSAGGSGRKFNHALLSAYNCRQPFLLSGGISLNDADQLRSLKLPKLIGVDINSRFETSPGIKDTEMVRQFISQLKKNI